MKKAFTLAEVLITLAIIGIVAALTIPTLISNYQKKDLEARLQKSYATIYNGMKLMLAEENVNTIKESSLGKVLYDKITPEEWQANMAKYFKIEDIDLGPNNKPLYETLYKNKYKTLNGKTLPPYGTYFIGYMKLTNQVILWLDMGFVFDTNHYVIFFDTNGPAEPNILGRDIFLVYLVDTKNGFQMQTYSQIFGSEKYSEEPGADCGTIGSSELTKNDYGFACLDRIMEENWKMNY